MEITIPRFWEEGDLEKIENLKTLSSPTVIMEEALVVGKRILLRSPHVLGIVCGPISSGPGTVEEKLQRFQLTVEKVGRKMAIFNQMPFEPLFAIVHEIIKDDGNLKTQGGTSHFFLDHFYEKIFALNKQWFPHFIHGWEESVGAKREHDLFQKKKVPLYYLEPDYHLK